MNQVLQFPEMKAPGSEPKAEAGPLYPLPLRLFKPGRALPVTVYRRSRTKGGAGEDAPACWRRGQSFSPPAGSGDDSTWGYFHLGDTAPLLAYLSKLLEEVAADGGAAPLEKARFLYDMTIVWTQHVFRSDPQALPPEQFRLAEVLIAHLLRLLSAGDRPQDIVLAIRRHDSGLFTHSVNVCMLGLAFVQYLGWPEQDAATFGLGALLHDMGMAALSQDTWTKTGPLTAAEQEDIRTHPKRGVQLLENFPALAGEVFLMAAQHHENDDSSGYPLGLPAQAIHPWARLLRLLDIYEAMTSIRPWRAPLSSLRALKVLRHGVGEGAQTPALLASFEQFCGLEENGG
jgi:HD-GYP domain-containing protein (c-di-GMP phosphodiesterase class II)